LASVTLHVRPCKRIFFFRRLLCVGDWCVYVSLFHNAIKHTRDIMQFLIPGGIYVYIPKDYNNFRVWGIGGRVVVEDLRRFNVHYVFPYTFLP
jgi:hypothetical protein